MLYIVWVGGTEVNHNYFDNIHDARLLARKYINTGYTDVLVEAFKEETIKRNERKKMPMPREYTILMRELVEDEMLDAKEVLFSLLNWLPEDDVYEFSQDEYDVAVNSAYKAKYDSIDASNEPTEEEIYEEV